MKRIGIAVLVAIAAALLTLHFRAHQPKEVLSGSLPSLAAHLPPGAPEVVYIDFAILRASPFLHDLVSVLPVPAPDPEYEKFIREINFDYSRDLDRLVVARWPALTPQRVLALAEGRFDHDRIIRYLLRSGKLEREGGRDFYMIPAGNGAPEIAFTFLANDRVAVTQGAGPGFILSVQAAAPLDADLRDHIASVAGSPVFAVVAVKNLPHNLSSRGPHPSQFENLLRGIRWLTLAGQPTGERLNISVAAECETPANARSLASTAEGLRLLGRAALAAPKTRGRFAPGDAALFEGLLRAAEISVNGQRVELRFGLTPEMLEALARVTPPTPRGN